MFEWSDLRYLLGIHHHGSTVAAARKLGVSQSTVHRRLVELERRFGVQLVTRHSTGYHLTEIGSSLIPHAERVEEAMLAFTRRIETLDHNVQGIVRVMPGFSTRVALQRALAMKVEDVFVQRNRALGATA